MVALWSSHDCKLSVIVSFVAAIETASVDATIAPTTVIEAATTAVAKRGCIFYCGMVWQLTSLVISFLPVSTPHQ